VHLYRTLMCKSQVKAFTRNLKCNFNEDWWKQEACVPPKPDQIDTCIVKWLASYLSICWNRMTNWWLAQRTFRSIPITVGHYKISILCRPTLDTTRALSNHELYPPWMGWWFIAGYIGHRETECGLAEIWTRKSASLPLHHRQPKISTQNNRVRLLNRRANASEQQGPAAQSALALTPANNRARLLNRR
jgi:hypothetical protein